MPNEIVDYHRKNFPGDKRSDLELTVLYTTRMGHDWVETKGRNLPNFYREYRDTYYGDESEFLKGAERGLRGLQSTAMGGVGLALDAVPGEVGFVEDWKQSALKAATEYGEKAAAPRLAPREPEFKNVETLGQLADYSGALFGEAAPSIAESIVVGAAGALAGSAVPGPGTVAGGITGIIGKTAAKKVLKDAVNKKIKTDLGHTLTEAQVKNALAKKGSKRIIEQVDDLVKRRAKSMTSQYGALTANALNSYGLSSGEIYNELANDPDVDPDTAFNVSLTFGAVAAAPDTILPSVVLKRMGVFDRIAGIRKTKATPKDRSAFMAYLTRFVPTAAGATSVEAVTEGFQEYVNISADKYAKGEGIDSPFELTPEEVGRLQRAAALGAAGGFLVSPLAAINVKEEAKDFETDEAKEDAEIKEISDVPKKKLVTPPPTTTELAPDIETNLKRLALLYVQGEALANPEIAAEIFEAKKDVGQRVRFNELVADYRRQVQLEALKASKEKELLTVADKKIAEGVDLTEDEAFAVQQRAEGVRKKSYVDTLIKVLGNEPLDEAEVKQVEERGGAVVESDGEKFGTTPDTVSDQETTDEVVESLEEKPTYTEEQKQQARDLAATLDQPTQPDGTQVRVVHLRDDDGEIFRHRYELKNGKVVGHTMGLVKNVDTTSKRNPLEARQEVTIPGTETGFIVGAETPVQDAMLWHQGEGVVLKEAWLEHLERMERLEGTQPEPAFERGSRGNIENAGDDLGKRAAVAHGVRKSKKFEGASQEFKDYVNGIMQEAEAAGYEFRDETGKKWYEGTTAEATFAPAEAADEALRLEDGEHSVIKRVLSPAVFKDGKLVGGSLLPQYQVVIFGPKEAAAPATTEGVDVPTPTLPPAETTDVPPTPPAVVDVDEITTMPAPVEVGYDYGETVTPFVETIKKTPPPPADEVNKVTSSDIAAKQEVIKEQSDKVNALAKLLGDLAKEQAKLTEKEDDGKLTEDEQAKLDDIRTEVSAIQDLINKLTNSISLQAKRIENLKGKLVSEDTIIDAETGEVSTVGSLNEDSLDYESGITFLVQEKEGEESATFRQVNKLLKGGQPAPAYYAIDPQGVATLDEALELLAQEGQEVGDLIQPPDITAQSKAFGKGASANTRRMTALYSKATGEVFVVGTGKIVRRKSPDFQKTVFFFRSHAGRKKGYLTLEQVREQGDLIPFASMRLTSPRTNPVFHFDSLGKYQERMGNAPNRVRETSEAVARTQASIQTGDVDTATPSPDFVAAVEDAPLLQELVQNEEVMGELFDYIEDDAKGVSESTRNLINEAVARHISQQGIAGELQELGRLDLSSKSSMDASLLGLLAEALDATFALSYEQDNAKQEFIGRAASLQPSLLGQTGGDTARPAITVKRLERRLRPINPVDENEQVLSFLYQRLPQEALRTLNEGHLGAAAIVAGRVRQKILDAEKSVPTTHRERQKLDAKIKAAEARELTAWAEENGLLFDGEEFAQNWIGQGRQSGMEHRVYYGRDGSVHKAISTGATWSEYFERIALNNWLFPSARYEFNGFAIPTEEWKQEMPHTGLLSRLDEGDMPSPIALDLDQPQALVSQPFINHVRPATEEEVSKHMEELGYLLIDAGAYDFYNPDTGVVVRDIHGENASIDESGSVVVFDSVPYRARDLDYTSEGQLEGLRRPPESTKTIHQVVKEFSVWHGSPHLFEQFLLEAIGRGEGYQAFGWGLYFAERRGVAEDYRRKLSRGGRGVILDDLDLSETGHPEPFKLTNFNLENIEDELTDWRWESLTRSIGILENDSDTKDFLFAAQQVAKDLDGGMEALNDEVNRDLLRKEGDDFASILSDLQELKVPIDTMTDKELTHLWAGIERKARERALKTKIMLKNAFSDIRNWWFEGGREAWIERNKDEYLTRGEGAVLDAIRNETEKVPSNISIQPDLLPFWIREDLFEAINGGAEQVKVNMGESVLSWRRGVETWVSTPVQLDSTPGEVYRVTRREDIINAMRAIKDGEGKSLWVEDFDNYITEWSTSIDEKNGERQVDENGAEVPVLPKEALAKGYSKALDIENVDWGMFSLGMGEWEGFEAYDHDAGAGGLIPSELIQKSEDLGFSSEEFRTFMQVKAGIEGGESKGAAFGSVKQKMISRFGSKFSEEYHVYDKLLRSLIELFPRGEAWDAETEDRFIETLAMDVWPLREAMKRNVELLHYHSEPEETLDPNYGQPRTDQQNKEDFTDTIPIMISRALGTTAIEFFSEEILSGGKIPKDANDYKGGEDRWREWDKSESQREEKIEQWLDTDAVSLTGPGFEGTHFPAGETVRGYINRLMLAEQDKLNYLNRLFKRVGIKNEGALYSVDLNAESWEFLLHDYTLLSQLESSEYFNEGNTTVKQRKKLAEILMRVVLSSPESGRPSRDKTAKNMADEVDEDGKMSYSAIEKILKFNPARSIFRDRVTVSPSLIRSKGMDLRSNLEQDIYLRRMIEDEEWLSYINGEVMAQFYETTQGAALDEWNRNHRIKLDRLEGWFRTGRKLPGGDLDWLPEVSYYAAEDEAWGPAFEEKYGEDALPEVRFLRLTPGQAVKFGKLKDGGELEDNSSYWAKNGRKDADRPVLTHERISEFLAYELDPKASIDKALDAEEAGYIVVDPGDTPLKKNQFLTDIGFTQARENYGPDAFLLKPVVIPGQDRSGSGDFPRWKRGAVAYRNWIKRTKGDKESAGFKSDVMKEAAETLRAAGFAGIKYFDGLSRDKGKGTNNYVMFDEARISIINRNGEKLSPTKALELVISEQERIARKWQSNTPASKIPKQWKESIDRDKKANKVDVAGTTADQVSINPKIPDEKVVSVRVSNPEKIKPKAYREILMSIANNKFKDESHRALARELADAKNPPLVVYADGSQEERFSLKGKSQAKGHYQTQGGVASIVLNDWAVDTSMDETMLHESLHHLTLDALTAPETPEQKRFARQMRTIHLEAVKKYNSFLELVPTSMWETVVSKNLGLGAIERHLESLPSETFTDLTREEATKISEILYASSQKEGVGLLEYGLADVDEFASSLTNPDFQKLLNAMQASERTRVSPERRSLWDQIVQLFVNFFNASEGSLLESVVTEVLGYNRATLGQTIKFSPEEQVDPIRPSDEQVKQKFIATLQSLATSGVDVQVLTDGLNKQLGMYSDRAIQLVIGDLANPTVDNFRLLLHEAGHDLFGQFTPDLRGVFHDSVQHLTDEELQVDTEKLTQNMAPDNPVFETMQEERLVDSVARELAASGFDPSEAKSWVKKVLNYLRELYYRAYIEVQRALLGSENVNGEIVRRYFLLRMQSHLTGNYTPNAITMMGGAPMTAEEFGQANRGDNSEVTKVYDFNTGIVELKEIPSTSVKNILWNSKRRVKFSEDGSIEEIPIDPQPLLSRQKAVEEYMQTFYEELYLMFNNSGENAEGIGFEKFVKDFLKSYVPADEITKLVENGARADAMLENLEETTARPKAAKEIYRRIEQVRAAFESAKGAAYSRKAESSMNRAKRHASKMKEFQAKYTDLTTYTENIVGIIDQALKEYANQTKTSKPHLVAKILKSLDPKYKYKNYKAALEKARRKALNMEDVFAAMGNMDLDFENTAPEQLALQIRTELAGTTLGSKVEDNVVIASVLGFAKRYPEAMILLQLRSDKNRGNVDRAINLMLSDNSAGITEARRLLRTAITKTKEGERLHQRILTLKNKIRLIFNYQEKLQNKVDAGVVLEPAMRQRQEEISSLFEAEEAVIKKEPDPATGKPRVVGVGQWEPLHESWVFVPTRPDLSVDEMWNSKKPDGTRSYQTKIRLSATEDFGKITKIIQLQGEWLAVNGEEGERHSKIKRQRDRLMEVQADFAQKELQQNFISRAIGDMASKLEGIGSAQSRQIGRRLRKWVSYVHTYGGRVTTGKGAKWAEAMDNAMKATNASSRESFMARFYDPFFTFAAENSHIIEMFPGNIAAAENEVLKRGKLYLSERTNGESDKAWSELERLFRSSAQTNGYIVNMGEQMGVKVLDEIKLPGGGVRHVFRKAIGSPMFSLMRKLNDNTKDLFNHLNQQFDYQSSTPEEALTDGNVRAAAEAGPEALLALFEGRFDDRTMKEFVEPIINRPTGAFDSSREQGGIAYDPAEIAAAWEATEGVEGAERVIQFAYNLAQSTATSEEQIVDTVTGIMRVFPKYYNRLSTFYQGLEAKQAANPVPVHTVMDARMAQDFPAEWLSYSTYSEREMRYYAEALSYESAFGRDLVGIRRDFDALVSELEGQVIAYKKIYSEVMDNGEVSKRMKSRKISEIIKKSATGKDGGNPRHYTVRVLKAAEKNLAMVKAEMARFEQANRNKTTQVEYGAAMELISSLTGATVQGLSTAITDLSTAVEGPFRKYGLSTFALSSLFKNVKYTALDAIGTLIQALPVSWNVNADRVKRRTRLGMVDDDALVTFRQRYVGAMGDEFRSEGMTGKAMEALSRGIGVLLQAGIGKAKNKDQLYTTLKAAPFTMFVNWQSAGVTDSTFDLFTDFVARAGEFFSQNPEAMADENYQLTAKDLGLKDRLFGLIQNEKAFDYIVNTMQQHGLSPTRLGREWVLNGKTNPLTDEHYRRIAALSATEMMLENTAVTQPSVMMSNKIMLAARPLLRWGVAKTADLAKVLPQLVDSQNLNIKDPNTRKALKAYRDFTIGMGMAIVPLSLAWAMLRDKYDEELVGKRANLMRFGEANPFFVMLDRLDRVGTFGMGGEVANTLLNMDNARQFGIDNRVFAVNSALSLVKATGTWIRQGDATYATVGRPAMMALGFGGALQNFQLANNLLGADNFESRYAARVNVNNILRSAGKELELDVRRFAGGGALPTPMKPWMTEMVLSAYANDGAAFRRAYRGALRAAKAMGKEDPEKSVKASLTMYHPLRYVFRTAPLENDFSRILRTAGGGRRDISEAIRLFNRYATELGIEPYMGKKDKKLGFDPFKRQEAPAGFARPRMDYKSFSVDKGSALPF